MNIFDIIFHTLLLLIALISAIQGTILSFKGYISLALLSYILAILIMIFDKLYSIK